MPMLYRLSSSTAKRPAYFKSDILSIWSLQFRKWSAETLYYLPILPWAPWHPLIKTTSAKKADTATTKTKFQICRNFMLHLHLNLNNCELVLILCRCFTAYRQVQQNGPPTSKATFFLFGLYNLENGAPKHSTTCQYYLGLHGIRS